MNINGTQNYELQDNGIKDSQYHLANQIIDYCQKQKRPRNNKNLFIKQVLQKFVEQTPHFQNLVSNYKNNYYQKQDQEQYQKNEQNYVYNDEIQKSQNKQRSQGVLNNLVKICQLKDEQQYEKSLYNFIKCLKFETYKKGSIITNHIINNKNPGYIYIILKGKVVGIKEKDLEFQQLNQVKEWQFNLFIYEYFIVILVYFYYISIKQPYKSDIKQSTQEVFQDSEIKEEEQQQQEFTKYAENWSIILMKLGQLILQLKEVQNSENQQIKNYQQFKHQENQFVKDETQNLEEEIKKMILIQQNHQFEFPNIQQYVKFVQILKEFESFGEYSILNSQSKTHDSSIIALEDTYVLQIHIGYYNQSLKPFIFKNYYIDQIMNNTVFKMIKNEQKINKHFERQFLFLSLLKNDVVYEIGEKIEYLYIVKSGQIQLQRDDFNIHNFEQGDMFGHEEFFNYKENIQKLKIKKLLEKNIEEQNNQQKSDDYQIQEINESFNNDIQKEKMSYYNEMCYIDKQQLKKRVFRAVCIGIKKVRFSIDDLDRKNSDQPKNQVMQKNQNHNNLLGKIDINNESLSFNGKIDHGLIEQNQQQQNEYTQKIQNKNLINKLENNNQNLFLTTQQQNKFIFVDENPLSILKKLNINQQKDEIIDQIRKKQNSGNFIKLNHKKQGSYLKRSNKVNLKQLLAQNRKYNEQQMQINQIQNDLTIQNSDYNSNIYINDIDILDSQLIQNLNKLDKNQKTVI
ncbi:Cyclic nucleotide-binding protein [Pseudocohnilembus persalinus]|uniref:Cyclic nucleotide-binding protein n=1 Tax=Pseudocohnilembus persalinus TaxID=266149 RepID=A0A0V0QUX5_PSEPJ|nr:Cyclic nucleotide-binding protein [Pseudocohnilembus persalinus]|eukprot:KRX05776.1 Cyclic nucleotide-binding protein [Pseudocohnilembus persalinus]